MANACAVYLDANEELGKIIPLLLSILEPDGEVLVEDEDPLYLVYSFRVNSNSRLSFVSVKENWDVCFFRTEVSQYRYVIQVSRGLQGELGKKLYSALKESDEFSVLYQRLQGQTEEQHLPATFVTDNSVITCKMPVEILFETHAEEQVLRQEMTQLSGFDFSEETEGMKGTQFPALGVRPYLYKLDEHDKDPGDRYYGTAATYCLRIFGMEEGPLRRKRRNEFAGSLYAKLQQSELFAVSIFEVAACQFLPFNADKPSVG